MDPPPSDTAWHHRLQEDSDPNTLGNMLPTSGSLCAQARGLSQRQPLEEYLPLCRPFSCYLLKDCWTNCAEPAAIWTFDQRFWTVQPGVPRAPLWQPGTDHLQETVPLLPNRSPAQPPVPKPA